MLMNKNKVIFNSNKVKIKQNIKNIIHKAQ